MHPGWTPAPAALQSQYLEPGSGKLLDPVRSPGFISNPQASLSQSLDEVSVSQTKAFVLNCLMS